jgi:alpha-galactosidase
VNATAFIDTDGQVCSLTLGHQAETATALLQFEQISAHHFRLRILPRKVLQLGRVEVHIELPYRKEDLLLCNGFQSWSTTQWLTPDARIPTLRRLARPLMRMYGDYHIDWVKRGRSSLHSWSWTAMRQAGNADIRLWGSVVEREGFTCFTHLTRENKLSVRRDCEGLLIDKPFTALEWIDISGSEDACYDHWFSAMDIAPVRTPTATGWTSWYHYYQHISADIIRTNYRASSSSLLAPSFFQIDDGWQQAVGDWLQVNTDLFPEGMAVHAREIRERSMQPGLWLAPFVADQRSAVFKKKPAWLLRKKNGQPLWAGYSAHWGGRFAAINTKLPDFREELARSLLTITRDWGYQMLKLDFLYAACLQPDPRQTRGQQMYELLVWLRQLLPDTQLLGCGMPLASGFGLLDYCRIGADIHLQWEHKPLLWAGNRERLSTASALLSTLCRWPLDRRAWRNDPDVFILRSHNQQLSKEQQNIILTVNTLLGGLLFTSDPLAAYGPAEAQQLRWLQAWKDSSILQVVPDNSGYKIVTDKGSFSLSINSSGGQMVFAPAAAKAGS